MLILSLFCENFIALRYNGDKRTLFGLFRHVYRGFTVGNVSFQQ